jgi:hypothetical protein
MMWRSEELKDFNTVESEPEGHLALPNSFSQARASKAQAGSVLLQFAWREKVEWTLGVLWLVGDWVGEFSLQ